MNYASASKSAAALAASKESAVPLAMTFHSPRSPVFLLISQVGTPSSVTPEGIGFPPPQRQQGVSKAPWGVVSSRYQPCAPPEGDQAVELAFQVISARPHVSAVSAPRWRQPLSATAPGVRCRAAPHSLPCDALHQGRRKLRPVDIA